VWGTCLTEFNGYPGWSFPRVIESIGLQLVPIEDPRAEVLVSLEYSRRSLYKVARRIPIERRVLIALEPEAVVPSQHSKRVRSKFGMTIVQSPLQVIAEDDTVVRMGYLPREDLVRSIVSEFGLRPVRNTALAVVNQNKFSFVKGNQYVVRRRLLQELSKESVKCVLAGPNWDKNLLWHVVKQLKELMICLSSGRVLELRGAFGPRIPGRGNTNIEYRGKVESVYEFLSEFQFSLVIENDPKYVSEKLFNAILSGAIPLYIGPPLGDMGIPEDVCLALPKSISAKEIKEKLDQLTGQDVSKLKQAGRSWILNEKTLNEWSHDLAWERIGQSISKFLAPN
jgi:hypothetical protein